MREIKGNKIVVVGILTLLALTVIGGSATLDSLNQNTITRTPPNTTHILDKGSKTNSAKMANQWSNFDRTKELVAGARVSSGGFTGLRPEDQSVYATHYFLRTINNLDISIHIREKTRSWLQSSLENDFKNGGIGTLSNDSIRYLRDYRDAVVSLSLLNSSAHNRSEVVADIRSFKTDDGGYCFAIDDRGNCTNHKTRVLATYYAITALDHLGALDSSTTQETREWLLRKWKTPAIFEQPTKIGTAHRTVATLEHLDVEFSELEGYDRNVVGIKRQLSEIQEAVDNDSIDLIQLQSYFWTLEILDTVPGQLDEIVISYLDRNRLPDGGYNVIGLAYSNSKGTAIGVSLLNATGADYTDRLLDEQMRTLIRIHSLDQGGFAPAFKSHRSISNTFYALQTLKTLSDYTATPATRQFIERVVDRVKERGVSNIWSIYRLTGLARMTGAAGFSHEQLKSALDKFSHNKDQSLRELYAAVNLAIMIEYELDREKVLSDVRSRKNTNGSFGSSGRSDNTYYAVEILKELNATVQNARDTVEWIRDSRVDKTGYGFKRRNRTGSHADLYATYLSVQTLSHLDERPTDPDGLRSWVASAESANGGFYLYPSASSSPKLRYTYYGVSVLETLRTKAETATAELETRDLLPK